MERKERKERWPGWQARDGSAMTMLSVLSFLYCFSLPATHVGFPCFSSCTSFTLFPNQLPAGQLSLLFFLSLVDPGKDREERSNKESYLEKRWGNTARKEVTGKATRGKAGKTRSKRNASKTADYIWKGVAGHSNCRDNAAYCITHSRVYRPASCCCSDAFAMK
jgi:hypothetical protein